MSADAKQKDHILLPQVKVSKRAHVLQMVGQNATQSSCIRSGLLFCVEFSDFDNTYILEWNENKSISCVSKNPHILQAKLNTSI